MQVVLAAKLPAGLLSLILLAVLCPLMRSSANAQGPMPEEGATLFPNGAFVSYSSILTMSKLGESVEADAPGAQHHPTFEHEIPLTFSWSFRRDFQLSAVLPIVTKRLELPGSEVGGTAVGDALVSFKYRFLRLDSERGTTQAAVTFGPKLPTGSTGEEDAQGKRLPAQLQAGSGSTDFLFKANLTYTGLFNFRKLVADPSFAYLLRTEGTQETRLGDEMEARLWIHYRPLQTRTVGAEWFIGPSIAWQHAGRDRQGGVRQLFTGSDLLTLGVTTYVSPRGGLVLWIGAEFPVAEDRNGAPIETLRRINFGVTKQFVLSR